MTNVPVMVEMANPNLYSSTAYYYSFVDTNYVPPKAVGIDYSYYRYEPEKPRNYWWNLYFAEFIRGCAKFGHIVGISHNRTEPTLVRLQPGACAKRKEAAPAFARAVKRAIRALMA